MPYDYITIPDGLLTTPPGSPRILIHTRHGKVVGIYCDQPAKVLVVETEDDPRRAVHRAEILMISPQSSTKLVGAHGTTVDRVLAMAFDDPSMDGDLRQALAAHEIVLNEQWPDIW